MEKTAPLPLRVPLDAKILKQLRAEKDRSATGVQKLFSIYQGKVPKGLTKPMVNGWLRGDFKTVRKDHLDFILASWRMLPSARRVPISEKSRAHLNALMDKTCLGEVLFMTLFKDAPEGLNDRLIRSWVNGATQSARADHFEFVISKYEGILRGDVSLPPRYRRIKMTHALQEEIKAELKRTRKAPARVFKQARKAPPKGLMASVVHKWSSGQRASARKDHLDYFFEAYAHCPDYVELYAEHKAEQGAHLMTPEMISALKFQIERTGIPIAKMARHLAMRDQSLAVRESVIYSWLNGKTKTASKEKYDFVLESYKAAPDLKLNDL